MPRAITALAAALVALMAAPAAAGPASGAEGLAPVALAPGVWQYGPFRVAEGHGAALFGETDAQSPRWFARLLRDHPGLTRLELIECPGTRDDHANLRLGRMIRAAGLTTHVPAHGSVRSGAVELFLAGAHRTIEDGAEFAVHSWRDGEGREAPDVAPDSRRHRAYLDYYREMGMTASRARAFYDFTNSVPHRTALWLEARHMRKWAAASVTELVSLPIPGPVSERPAEPATALALAAL